MQSRHRITVLLVVPILWTLGAACGGDSGAAVTGPPQPCAAPVTLTVSGTFGQPRFSWSPNCLASELLVVAPASEGNSARWWIDSPTGFPSGVTYGVLPVGATEYISPRTPPFTAGTTVWLQRADGERVGFATLPVP